MIFGASTFLYLLPLAGLPILFHFMLKLKKRQVVFSTLMFLRRTDPRLNSRRKIQQWLLLLMRMLLIMFILLALSRPVLEIASGLGGNEAVIVLVDNSGSMLMPADEDRTKLDCAIEGARKLIASLESGCQGAVFTLVDDPEVEQTGFLTSDKELLLGVLDSIKTTEASGDPETALYRAFDFIGNSVGKSGSVHIFTDLQAGEWGGQSGRISPSGGIAVTVYLHKIESAGADFVNAAISAVEFPEETILPGHPYTFRVVVKNTCDSPVTVRLNSIDSQETENTKNVTLQPRAYQASSLTFVPKEEGFGWIKVWLEGDDFTADNTACIGIRCNASENVLFAGDAPEFGVAGPRQALCRRRGCGCPQVCRKRRQPVDRSLNGVKDARKAASRLARCGHRHAGGLFGGAEAECAGNPEPVLGATAGCLRAVRHRRDEGFCLFQPPDRPGL